ncbi:MAG: PAS domain S-box protein [bacterium]|nr:PAS domain S-box protein [bacterium]
MDKKETFENDIAKHKHMETARIALHHSEEQYRAVTESAGESICTVNAEGEFMFMNSVCAKRLGGSRDDLIGKTLWDVLPKEFADQEASHIQKIFASGEGFIQETTIPFNNKVRWYQISKEPIRDHNGNVHLALIIARDINKRKRAEESLKTALAKLMTARDEERKYLAAELHDSVSQKLVSLGIQLDNIARDNSELHHTSDICNEIIADIRRLCHGLYPPSLEALGLAAAIQQLEAHCKSAGMISAISCDPLVTTLRFGPETEIALFRIAQEAVNNAIRHSHGKHVDIDLVCSDGQLVLAIIDDGKGFDTNAARGKGIGLSSMRDRALAIRAKYTITSEPGETRVEVIVDLGNNIKKGR